MTSDSAPVLTIGSVFSGIGGFELGFLAACEAAGIPARIAWMCEIDPSAQKVLRERFPDAVLYDDITTLDPAEVEPVDIYVGGSPCQGFSMAGARTGLGHIESRLFTDYVRVMDGLAQRGLSYALWENVPGALSQRNQDGTPVFPQLIAALTLGLDAPLGDADVVAGRFRADARWNAGLAGDGRRAVSWRVLDSRHFGVPQRRRRVFACVAFGRAATRRAYEVLLESEGVSGDLATCQQEGQGAAGAAGEGAETRSLGFHGTQDPISLTEAALPLEARNGQYGQCVATPAVLLTMREGKPGGGKGPLLSAEQSLTLATGNGQVLFAPDAAGTVIAGLSHGGTGSVQDAVGHVATTYGVRRLTPIECERLQGFPDGWTDPCGADTARYQALGNAVTVNTVRWIFGRIVSVDNRREEAR